VHQLTVSFVSLIRYTVVTDGIFCIFIGALENTSELRRHYGLSRQATEAMVVVEAYKVLRDRAPYPPDQVIKDLEGKFAIILFDATSQTLFLARVSSNSLNVLNLRCVCTYMEMK
jgi:asparagine synthetase B (glutamine-hydrolysing)